MLCVTFNGKTINNRKVYLIFKLKMPCSYKKRKQELLGVNEYSPKFRQCKNEFLEDNSTREHNYHDTL